MPQLIALISGLLFGAGIIISGMANPEKVLAFLDLAGNWDPSLALVMAAAIPVSGIAFRLIEKRKTTLGGHPVQLPDTKQINWHLITGSALFGTGWGLAGICPGPAIILSAQVLPKGCFFAFFMLFGMAIFTATERLGMLSFPSR